MTRYLWLRAITISIWDARGWVSTNLQPAGSNIADLFHTLMNNVLMNNKQILSLGRTQFIYKRLIKQNYFNACLNGCSFFFNNKNRISKCEWSLIRIFLNTINWGEKAQFKWICATNLSYEVMTVYFRAFISSLHEAVYKWP